jgi:hypothetical protein
MRAMRRREVLAAMKYFGIGYLIPKAFRYVIQAKHVWAKANACTHMLLHQG